MYSLNSGVYCLDSGVHFKVSDDRKDVLADINAFSLEGRYPESYAVLPSKDEAESIIRKAGEVYLWLKSQL